MPTPTKPDVRGLLIASAIDAELCERLLAAPDEAFRDFDLTEEEKDLLRHPDHRLLPLFGAMLARQHESSAALGPPVPAWLPPQDLSQARMLPDLSLALTVVPCAQYEDGRLSAISFAVWVNPLPEGVDPATLPPPPGAKLPGEPVTPLHAVIRVSVTQMQDAAGNPQVGLSAAFLQSTNITAPPHAAASGRPDVPPSGRSVGSPAVQAAVAAVRNAIPSDRYVRIVDLIRALQDSDV